MKLGQHFLIKGSALERIAAAACPPGTELVLEIGPGRGALTQKLLKRAARVVAIELDPYLADHLRRKFAAEPRLEVVHADVLQLDLAQWAAPTIAGNLPYYITSPILEKTVRLPFRRAVFLVQKEVAERLAAAPGSRAYGYLTVGIACFARVTPLFDVKPSAFHPPPKVDSTAVLLEPAARPADLDAQAFLTFAAQCFRQKRKTIRNNLVATHGKQIEAWPEAGLRAEQIPLAGLIAMFRRLTTVSAPAPP